MANKKLTPQEIIKVEKRHGERTVQDLRNEFGSDFAKGQPGDMKLPEVLDRLDGDSLNQLLQSIECKHPGGAGDPWGRTGQGTIKKHPGGSGDPWTRSE